MQFIINLFTGDKFIYTVEAITFLAIIVLLFYFYVQFNVFKND
jgi:hypothetical protein